MNVIVPFNRNNNELADKDEQLIHLENLIESKRCS